MTQRTIINISIIIFFISSIALVLFYGPASRKYTLRPKTIQIASSTELETSLRSEQIHGRIAVILTHHLKPQNDGSFPQSDYIEKCMQEGVIRKSYFVYPDYMATQAMVEIVKDQNLIMLPQHTEYGGILHRRGGRIVLTTLSGFLKQLPKEQVLLIYEPSFWNIQERSIIERMLSTRQLDADLVAMVGF